MKPHPEESKPWVKPTKSKPRIAKSRGYNAAGKWNTESFAKPSPRQPDKGARMKEGVYHVSHGMLFTQPHEGSRPVLLLDPSPGARERRCQKVADRLACYVYGDPIKELPEPYQKACKEIADSALSALGDTPAGEGRGK